MSSSLVWNHRQDLILHWYRVCHGVCLRCLGWRRLCEDPKSPPSCYAHFILTAYTYIQEHSPELRTDYAVNSTRSIAEYRPGLRLVKEDIQQSENRSLDSYTHTSYASGVPPKISHNNNSSDCPLD